MIKYSVLLALSVLSFIMGCHTDTGDTGPDSTGRQDSVRTPHETSSAEQGSTTTALENRSSSNENPTPSGESDEDKLSSAPNGKARSDSIRSLRDAFQALGILRLDDPRKKGNVVFSIYNRDSTLFNQIEYRDNMIYITSDTSRVDLIALSKSDVKDHVLDPYELDPGYGLIHFKVSGSTSSTYEIIVNSDGLKKYVRNSEAVRYEEWEEYLVGTMPGIDEEWVYRSEPDSNSAALTPDPQSFDIESCIPEISAIEGDWMKLSCDSYCGGIPEMRGRFIGWTRWHANGHLRVESDNVWHLC